MKELKNKIRTMPTATSVQEKNGETPTITAFQTTFNTPNYVGGYRLGNHNTYYTQFNLSYKPNWLHRTMMRLCFGFYWKTFKTKEK